jgi:hypothetical protein
MASEESNGEGQHPRSPNHNARGRFKAGNKAGHLARGISKGERQREALAVKRAAQEVRQAAIEAAKKTVVGSLPLVIESLRARAIEGDTAAIALMLKHSLPLTGDETTIVGGEGLEQLPPERRVQEINRRMLQGTMPIEHARAAMDSARQEIESSVILPLRTIMLDLKRGIPAVEAVSRLIHLADTLDNLDAIDVTAEIVAPESDAVVETDTAEIVTTGIVETGIVETEVDTLVGAQETSDADQDVTPANDLSDPAARAAAARAGFEMLQAEAETASKPKPAALPTFMQQPADNPGQPGQPGRSGDESGDHPGDPPAGSADVSGEPPK